jgi:prepilin-type N-terminal cleavage/methylation domain-containing protein
MEILNRSGRRQRRGQTGFTLIELLVVIAVLAILAAIVLFNVVGVTNRGKSSACDTDVKTFQTAVDAAINDASASNTTAASLHSGDMLAVPHGGENDLSILSDGGYIHEGNPPTTACTSLTLTLTGATISSGATVSGSS